MRPSCRNGNPLVNGSGADSDSDLQYRYHSQTLGEGRGGIRKINGSTLGEVRNRRSGRAIRLDRAALSGALRLGRLLVDEMERDL